MENSTQICSHCQHKKAPYTCGICQDQICKNCVQFAPENAFYYLNVRAVELNHNHYCNVCFDQHIQSALDNYETTLARAREILVFDKTQGKETRFIRRMEKPLIVENGLDEQDVTLRLAYMAASKNYNSIVDLDIKAIKVRNGAYQTTHYKGTANPVNVSDHKLLKDRSLWSDPN